MGIPRDSDPVVQAFLRAYPNPERIGCPGETILRLLASRKLGIDHPASDHLGRCSPCFKEFRGYQHEFERKRSIKARQKYGMIAASIALVVFGAAYFVHQQKSLPSATGPYQVASLNLQHSRVFRGDSNDQEAQTSLLEVPRGRALLHIMLPAGSTSGEYEVQFFRDSSAPPLFSKSAEPVPKNGRLELEIKVEIETSPGLGILGVRKDNSTWRYYEVQIK